MKTHSLLSLVFALGALAQEPAVSPSASSAPLAAPEAVAVPEVAVVPPEKPREFKDAPQVRVDVLMVSVPEDRALALLPELRNPASIATAQAKLLELINLKQATLVDWPEVTTLSGQRCVSENIVEERYPIEFGVPGAPKVAEDPAKAASLLVDANSVTPTTFETRNVGRTIEVEPVVSEDGQEVFVQIAPQLVRFQGAKEFAAGITQKGEKLTVTQPIFETRKVSTNLILRDGERRLIFFGKGPQGTDRVDLFILGVTVIPVQSKGK